MALPKPPTKTQLAGYFGDYRAAFPEWEVRHGVALMRSNGVVSQHISFEALRSGGYRPTCAVYVLGVPDAQVLARFLTPKYRQVMPREHESSFLHICRAMEDQFLPAIRQPLDTANVLDLAEQEVARDRIDSTNYSVALATLSARTGRMDRAEWWCDRVPEQLALLGRPPADWQLRHVEYARRLRDAIRQRRTDEFFDAGTRSTQPTHGTPDA
jgi:hypothetical protein